MEQRELLFLAAEENLRPHLKQTVAMQSLDLQ